jgi:hypothetical protein
MTNDKKLLRLFEKILNLHLEPKSFNITEYRILPQYELDSNSGEFVISSRDILLSIKHNPSDPELKMSSNKIEKLLNSVTGFEFTIDLVN